MYNIDVKLLHDAYEFYQRKGYKPLSAPLLVDEDIVKLTLPEGKVAKKHLGKYYVGSAEQSFYQLIKDGLVPEGGYMMLTPCQRDEDLDESHLEIFLKLELISTKKSYVNIAKDAYDFYEAMGEDVVVSGGALIEGLDLEINGIEVGSYNHRIYDKYVVNFGTGLALPRFDYATKRWDLTSTTGGGTITD